MSSKSEKNTSAKRKIMQRAALLIWAALIVLIFINRDKITVEAITGFTPENVLLTALVMIALFALKTLSIVFYSGILFTASGIMFSLPVAMIVNILGAFTMLTEGYFIGRSAGSGLVAELTEKYPKFREFTGLKDENPFMFALLLRMLKVINYDLGSMYMGASGVPLLPFYAGSLTALLPEIVVFALVGNGIVSSSAMPFAAAAVLYAACCLISVFMLRSMMKKHRQI